MSNRVRLRHRCRRSCSRRRLLFELEESGHLEDRLRLTSELQDPCRAYKESWGISVLSARLLLVAFGIYDLGGGQMGRTDGGRINRELLAEQMRQPVLNVSVIRGIGVRRADERIPP